MRKAKEMLDELTQAIEDIKKTVAKVKAMIKEAKVLKKKSVKR